jgi:hypothetical protein
MRNRVPMIALFAVLAAGTLGSLPADAGKGRGKGKQVKFVGVHPIPKGHGGGVCHIEAPHVHVYAPQDAKVQYRMHDDSYYFVGDPVAYGWDGPRHSYYGHHPVQVDVTLGDRGDHVEYCYLDGAHFHSYAPPAELKFEVQADAYWYVGDMPAAYVEARAELDPIDVVYEPIVYARPVVVVETPPPAWVGVRYAVAAPVVEVETPKVKVKGHGHGRGHVDAEVQLVAPSLSVEIGVPAVVVDTHVHGGVIIDDHHHHHHKGKYKGHKGHKRKAGKWSVGKRRGR